MQKCKHLSGPIFIIYSCSHAPKYLGGRDSQSVGSSLWTERCDDSCTHVLLYSEKRFGEKFGAYYNIVLRVWFGIVLMKNSYPINNAYRCYKYQSIHINISHSAVWGFHNILTFEVFVHFMADQWDAAKIGIPK